MRCFNDKERIREPVQELSDSKPTTGEHTAQAKGQHREDREGSKGTWRRASTNGSHETRKAVSTL